LKATYALKDTSGRVLAKFHKNDFHNFFRKKLCCCSPDRTLLLLPWTIPPFARSFGGSCGLFFMSKEQTSSFSKGEAWWKSLTAGSQSWTVAFSTWQPIPYGSAAKIPDKNHWP
jgi:hypothetical protein